MLYDNLFPKIIPKRPGIRFIQKMPDGGEWHMAVVNGDTIVAANPEHPPMIMDRATGKFIVMQGA